MNYFSKFDMEAAADTRGLSSGGHVHTETPHTTHAPAGAIVVPDAQLLFGGEFKRSGVDLVLSAADRELVLHDYFKGEKRAALSSPDGAHLSGDLVNALAGHVEYAQADGNASGNKVIGHVTKLTGTATAIRNGVSIILNNGDNVEKGDVVQSGSASTLGITFIDGTVFGLSSNARMVLNEMVYDPNGSNNSSLLSLVAGTITFVAGDTAKHGDMKVDTPVATMGIRGTAVLVEIDFAVGGQGVPETKFQVLVEPDGTTGSYVLLDKTTLAPLAVVNQAGQQITIADGVLSQATVPLSPDVQQLITDVFSLKFSDNSNPKTLEHHTDTITPPQSLPPIKLADGGGSATPLVVNVGNPSGPSAPTGNTPSTQKDPVTLPTPDIHVSQSPSVVSSSAALAAGTAGGGGQDSVSGTIRFADINAGDLPTVQTKFDSFKLLDAQHNDITATLTADQLANIAAVETGLTVTPSSTNNNIGSATWTYSAPDSAFSFLAGGEMLILTYEAIVDNNFQPSDQMASAPFTITITALDNAKWINQGPGLWSVGANWTSGAAPTANANVFIIADPALNTPVVVTIDAATVALAQSLTIGDIGGVGAELDNLNTLTIGPGGLNLSADAILKNLGTLSIGGLAEILQSSTLQNSGSLKLNGGGDFLGASNISNSGTIELAGGVLNVQVNIANANNTGSILVDGGATLTLSEGGAIAGGSLTLASLGVLDIEKGAVALPSGAPDGALEGMLVSGTISGALSTIEVGAASAAVLELTDGTRIASGELTIGISGTLEVEKSTFALPPGAPDATLDGVTVMASAPTSTIAVGAAAVLTLDDAATITHGALTVATGGTLDTESTFGATLNGVAVTAADATSTVKIGGTIAAASILTLDNGTTITNGNLTIAGGSTLDVESSGGATLDGVNVTGAASTTIASGTVIPASLIEIGATVSGVALTIEGDTTVTNGSLTIGAGGTLDVEGALLTSPSAVLDGVTVQNSATSVIEISSHTSPIPNRGGSILVLDDGTTVTNGEITIAAGGNLSVDGPTGATLDGVAVTGVPVTGVQPPQVIVQNSGLLLMDDGASLKNVAMTIEAGSTLDVETSLGAALHGVTVMDSATTSMIEVGISTSGAAGNLLLDNGTSITGGTLTIGASGTLDVEKGATGPGATLDGVAVAADATDTIEIGVVGAATTLLLDDGTTITNAANFTIAGGSTLDVEAGATGPGATLDGVNVTGADAMTVPSGATIPASLIEIGVSGVATLLLDDGTSITGGSLTIAGGSTLDIESVAGATLDGVAVTGTNATLTAPASTIEVGVNTPGGSNLTLIGVTTITGGILTISGGSLLDIQGGAIWDNVAVADTESQIQVGAATTSANLTLIGATAITGGSLTISGGSALDIEAGANGTGVTLDGVTVLNVNVGTIIEVGAPSSVTLLLDDGTKIRNDTLTIAGGSTVDVESGTTGPGATLDGVMVMAATTTSTIEIGVSGAATLLIDDGTSITGGDLTIGAGSTLDIELGATGPGAGATLDGVTVMAAATTSTIEIGVAGAATLLLDGGTKITMGNLTVAAGTTLDVEGSSGATLDGVTVTGTETTTVASGSIIPGSTIEIGASTPGGSTLTLNGGTTITNGILSVAAGSVLDVEAGGATLDNLNVLGAASMMVASGTVIPASLIEIGATAAGVVLTLDDKTEMVGGAVTIGGGSTLDVEGASQELLIDVKVTGTAKTTVASGTVIPASTIEIGATTPSGSILTINSGTSITDGALTIAGGSTLDIQGSATLANLAVTGTDTIAVPSGAIIPGSTVQVGLSTTTTQIPTTLLLDDGTTITNGNLTIAGGSTLDVEAGANGTGATLDNVKVLGTAAMMVASGAVIPASLIEIGATVSGAVLTLDDGTSITNGTLTIGGGSTLDVEAGTNGPGAELHGVTVTDAATSLIEVGATALGAATLLLDTGTTITNGSLTIASNGTLDSTGNDAIIGVTIVNNGTIEVQSGSLTINQTSTISGTGALKIDAGTSLDIDSASGVPSGQTVTFESTTGLLRLDHAENFHGTVAGFSTADGTQANSDQIDLVDINHQSTNFTETFNAATDQLTVSDGAQTATIQFIGTVGTLNFVDDGNPINGVAGTSGTLVFDPPATNTSVGGVTAHDPALPAAGTIVASAANQTLTGAAISDTFVFNFAAVGQSKVTDFHPASDVLQFNSSIFANAQAALNAAHDDGHGNTVIAIDAHDSVTLNGVAKAQLHAADFHFV